MREKKYQKKKNRTTPRAEFVALLEAAEKKTKKQRSIPSHTKKGSRKAHAATKRRGIKQKTKSRKAKGGVRGKTHCRGRLNNSVSAVISGGRKKKVE